MAFFPFTSAYSDGWQSRRPANPYDRFYGQDYYSQPSFLSQGYREPAYYSPYQGLGNDYVRPRQSSATSNPLADLFGASSRQAHPRRAWDNLYPESSESEDEAEQAPCSCGRCHLAADQRPRQVIQPRSPAQSRQRQSTTRPNPWQAWRQQQEEEEQQRMQEKYQVLEEEARRQRARAAARSRRAQSQPVVEERPETEPKTSADPTSTSDMPVVEPQRAASPADRHEQAAPAAEAAPEMSIREKRLAKVEAVRSDLDSISEEVAQFSGERGSKPYLKLEDLLTKALLRLDSVEAGDDKDVRDARRSAVHAVQKLIDQLERGNASEPVGDSAGAENDSILEADEGVTEHDLECDDSSFEIVNADTSIDTAEDQSDIENEDEQPMVTTSPSASPESIQDEEFEDTTEHDMQVSNDGETEDA